MTSARRRLSPTPDAKAPRGCIRSRVVGSLRLIRGSQRAIRGLSAHGLVAASRAFDRWFARFSDADLKRVLAGEHVPALPRA
jgi:hypothetical protein